MVWDVVISEKKKFFWIETFFSASGEVFSIKRKLCSKME
jgi:hypothetical protein